MKYIFITDFFECSALALWLKVIEKQDVKVLVRDKGYKKILEGLVEHVDDVFKYLGQGNIFIFDDAASGKTADVLRSKGEMVFGGNEISDRMENERSFGQKIMKEAGINTVSSRNFKGSKAFESAISFVKSNPGRYVIKQNGDQDKSLSTVGKFEDGQDVMDKLNDMKRIWEGEVDFDLQDFVDGHEVAIEGWFNGKDWVKDKNGEPVFLINFEHKKKSEGDTGRTTGETCTLAYRTKKDVPINKELQKITEYLKKIKYVGNIDINFMLSKKDKKFYGLEFTNRFGYPMLNLQQEMFKSPWSKLLTGCAKGENNFLEVDPRWAVVVVVQVPPFPFCAVKDEDSAKGQRIYFLEKGKWTGKDSFPTSKLKHIHLYEVKIEKESKHYVCSGDTGYLITVTAQADDIKKANEMAINYIKENIYTSNMDYRKDCGINPRVTEAIKFLFDNKLM